MRISPRSLKTRTSSEFWMPAGGGVERIDEDPLRKGFLQPIHAGHRRVDARQRSDARPPEADISSPRGRRGFPIPGCISEWRASPSDCSRHGAVGKRIRFCRRACAADISRGPCGSRRRRRPAWSRGRSRRRRCFFRTPPVPGVSGIELSGVDRAHHSTQSRSLRPSV